MSAMDRSARVSGWFAIIALAMGCAGPDPSEAGSDDSTTEAGTTEETMTASMTSGADSATSTTTSTSTGTSTTHDDAAETDDDTGGSEEGTDTEAPDACADLDRVACQESEACRPIACAPFENDIGGAAIEWCLGDPAYIGCVAADLGCPEVRTVACDDDEDAVYMCPDGCLPKGFTECDPPAVGALPCDD